MCDACSEPASPGCTIIGVQFCRNCHNGLVGASQLIGGKPHDLSDVYDDDDPESLPAKRRETDEDRLAEDRRWRMEEVRREQERKETEMRFKKEYEERKKLQKAREKETEQFRKAIIAEPNEKTRALLAKLVTDAYKNRPKEYNSLRGIILALKPPNDKAFSNAQANILWLTENHINPSYDERALYPIRKPLAQRLLIPRYPLTHRPVTYMNHMVKVQTNQPQAVPKSDTFCIPVVHYGSAYIDEKSAKKSVWYFFEPNSSIVLCAPANRILWSAGKMHALETLMMLAPPKMFDDENTFIRVRSMLRDIGGVINKPIGLRQHFLRLLWIIYNKTRGIELYERFFKDYIEEEEESTFVPNLRLVSSDVPVSDMLMDFTYDQEGGAQAKAEAKQKLNEDIIQQQIQDTQKNFLVFDTATITDQYADFVRYNNVTLSTVLRWPIIPSNSETKKFLEQPPANNESVTFAEYYSAGGLYDEIDRIFDIFGREHFDLIVLQSEPDDEYFSTEIVDLRRTETSFANLVRTSRPNGYPETAKDPNNPTIYFRRGRQ